MYDPPRGTAALQAVVDFLRELDVVWWLDYGALLGSVWRGGRLPWDADVDISVMAEAQDEVIRAARLLELVGLHARALPPTGRAFGGGDRLKVAPMDPDQLPVELCFWHRDARGRLYRREYVECDRGKGRDFDEALLFPLRTIAFEGVEVLAPARARELCVLRYGHEWTEPEIARYTRIRVGAA